MNEQVEQKMPYKGHNGFLVSVIIPHFNDLNNLQRCLSLLLEQTLTPDSFEIIVADNNSACGLAEVSKICGAHARLVSAPIQGAAEARNVGVAASRGRYLAFIDSDCCPSCDWLERGVAALSRSEMVGGRVETVAGDEGNLTAVEAFEKVFAFDFKRYVETEGFSGAGNMFVPRNIFDHVGGFRLGVSEDKDWGRRAVALGFHWIYDADVQVSHRARKNWEELKNKWRRITRESYKLEKERPFGRIHWMMRAWVVLVSPFVHVMYIFYSSKLDRLDDKLKAIGVLFRIRLWRFIESYRVLANDLSSS